jgi:ABC-type transporter Mla subunit MlaD
MNPLTGLGDVVRWGSRLVDEIAALPETLGAVRSTITDAPDQLRALIQALEQTTAALERALPELTRALATMSERLDHVDGLASDLAADLTRTAASLDRILPEVSGAIGTMDTRVQSLDATISDLGRIVFSVIDAIPGARRVLRRPASPGEGG